MQNLHISQIRFHGTVQLKRAARGGGPFQKENKKCMLSENKKSIFLLVIAWDDGRETLNWRWIIRRNGIENHIKGGSSGPDRHLQIAPGTQLSDEEWGPFFIRKLLSILTSFYHSGKHLSNKFSINFQNIFCLVEAGLSTRWERLFLPAAGGRGSSGWSYKGGRSYNFFSGVIFNFFEG